jgi:hypothetical protein
MAYNNTNESEQNLIVINSAFRLNPTTSNSGNFTYSVNKHITRITALVLKYVQIPFTFYTINNTNNVLTFNNGTKTATIPVGNYTAQTILATLTTVINTVFADTATTVTYNSATFKLTIARGTPFIVDAVTSITASTAAPSLGFYVSSANSVSVTADSTINIAGPNYININSAFLTKPARNLVAFSNGNINYNTTLATIPNNVAPGDFIYFELNRQIDYGYNFEIKTTDIIDITITDEFGNILNLNGANLSIQLFALKE